MIVRLGAPARLQGPPVRSAGMAGVLDDATAVVVGAQQGLPPGELARRGMAGLGDFDITATIDKLTGGKATQVSDQLDRLEMWLQVAVVASLFAGGAALMALRRK